MNDAPQVINSPHVGIFWGILRHDGYWLILSEKTPVTQAESYGASLTHAGGHYEFWESLQSLGAAALERKGLPVEPANHEYEEFPRGRVVYWPGKKHFTIYADRRLQHKVFIRQLIADFGIPYGTFSVRSDPHYSRGFGAHIDN